MWLIGQGKTQYETFRWLDLQKHLIRQEEERQLAAASLLLGHSRPKGGLLGRVAKRMFSRRPKVWTGWSADLQAVHFVEFEI